MVGATNSGPGSDPQSRIRFREQEERARREYDEQKRAEALKKLEESRKTVEDAIAMRDLYQRDPAEYWRVMENRNERGCSEGKFESCQYLSGLYRSQSRFADARRALVREREALEAVKRDPEGYDEKYWGGTSLPKRAAIQILLADNAKRLEAFDRDRK